MDKYSTRNFFGRRRGKALRQGRRVALEKLLPPLQIQPSKFAPGSLNPKLLFDQPIEEIWLEIGFGAGEHLATLAKSQPSTGFIGCDPFVNGVARLLLEINRHSLDNIRIVIEDASLLLDSLKSDSIGTAILLFPDPWPKRRHNKRRFVEPKNIAKIARVLADEAEWRMATDHMGYCRWILDHMTNSKEFDWLARRPNDWRTRPDCWPGTRYESKAIDAGQWPAYLIFRRRNRDLS